MPTDNSLIMGERRPLAGTEYQYRLRVQYETVRWEVWYGTQYLTGNESGSFLFKNPSLGIGLVIRAYYTTKAMPGLEMLAELAVKPVPGRPEFLVACWQDSNLEDINKKEVTYLDDAYLTVRTVNIVPGDWLSAKIKDKDYSINDHPSDRILFAEVDESGIARFKVSSELLKLLSERLNALDNFSIHCRYYAEISYSGVEIPGEKPIKLFEESAILHVYYARERAISLKNEIKPVFIEKEKEEKEKKKPVKLKLNVFFDGTKNNRENVRARKNVEEKMANSDQTAAYEKHTKGDNSYNQDYSNIAIMQWCDAADERKREISIYIEGIGTEDLKGDSTFWGMGLDWLSTGIRAKVEKAINQILEKRQSIGIKKDEYVSEAKVNVFGFSRGAAAARRFTCIKRSEIALNVLTSKMNVIFTFVGLFETVSASGLNHSNDTKSLSLDIGGKALKVLQLKALDEYRFNFNLTNIQSSIDAGVGYEFAMPGAHSDIGGGYMDKAKEDVRESYNNGFIDRLIKEGWYIESNRGIVAAREEYVSTPNGSVPARIPEHWRASRTISNAYQYIPLEIMAYFAEKYGDMTFETTKLIKYYGKIPKELEPFHKFVDEAKAKDGVHSIKATELEETERNLLRNKYLHLSAYREGGQIGGDNPIIDYIANRGRYGKGDLPKRKIIDG